MIQPAVGFASGTKQQQPAPPVPEVRLLKSRHVHGQQEKSSASVRVSDVIQQQQPAHLFPGRASAAGMWAPRRATPTAAEHLSVSKCQQPIEPSPTCFMSSRVWEELLHSTPMWQQPHPLPRESCPFHCSHSHALDTQHMQGVNRIENFGLPALIGACGLLRRSPSCLCVVPADHRTGGVCKIDQPEQAAQTLACV